MTEQEAAHRSKNLAKKASEQSRLGEAAKAEEARTAAKVEEHYAVSSEELARVNDQLEFRRRQLQLVAKRREMEDLHKAMAECMVVQERLCREAQRRREEEKRLENQLWLRFFQEQREEAKE